MRTISINCRLNPTRIHGTPTFTAGGNKRYATFRRSQDRAQPAGTAVFLNERSDGINDGGFGVDPSNPATRDGTVPRDPYWVLGYPAGYHHGTAEVSFADGHVEAHRWLEPTTLVPLGRAKPGSDTSPTNRDVRWLQDHRTCLRP